MMGLWEFSASAGNGDHNQGDSVKDELAGDVGWMTSGAYAALPWFEAGAFPASPLAMGNSDAPMSHSGRSPSKNSWTSAAERSYMIFYVTSSPLLLTLEERDDIETRPPIVSI